MLPTVVLYWQAQYLSSFSGCRRLDSDVFSAVFSIAKHVIKSCNQIFIPYFRFVQHAQMTETEVSYVFLPL